MIATRTLCTIGSSASMAVSASIVSRDGCKTTVPELSRWKVGLDSGVTSIGLRPWA